MQFINTDVIIQSFRGKPLPIRPFFFFFFFLFLNLSLSVDVIHTLPLPF